MREGLVERREDDHKGVYGHALIVAGSRGMAGAAILAARAALRSGAGLVTAAVPSGVASTVAGAIPSALTLSLPENAAGAFRPEGVERLKQYAKDRRVAAFALGPGLSTQPDAARFVLHALSCLPLPAVVDADALNILAAQDPAGVAQMFKARRRPCVFTPHPAEMSRLLKTGKPVGETARIKAVERLSCEWGGVALLKGRRTLISSGLRTVVNLTGGPSLAKAGSGDVLTGLVLGLWTQALASGRLEGDLAFKSAALGAWLHGTAGDLAEKELTAWAATSEDLVDFLPKAFKTL
ncbi:MAG: NAD(P)H-hydrate dehydratase [Elusimicrobia bacterium GWC2_65_9]|nr:MAG: NAD(P)H-hydrate dehydratase [Elusimicrobia bacterium GWA2_66_18]OGR77248.1 MAG: NAD(P)H-hydrate dehydratase [Elusimicrobia bacterium GWC2_65_9]